MYNAAKLYQDEVFKFPCASHRMNSVMKDMFVSEKIVIKVCKNATGDEHFLQKYNPATFKQDLIKLSREDLKKISTRNEV
jgi:hypothetical protein